MIAPATTLSPPVVPAAPTTEAQPETRRPRRARLFSFKPLRQQLEERRDAAQLRADRLRQAKAKPSDIAAEQAKADHWQKALNELTAEAQRRGGNR